MAGTKPNKRSLYVCWRFTIWTFVNAGLGLEQLDGMWESNLELLISAVGKTPTHVLEFDERFKQKSALFPHLRVGNIFGTYILAYLPIDFTDPIVASVQVYGRLGMIDELEPFPIASSQKLSTELEVLEPVLNKIISLKGLTSPISPFYNTYTWDGVIDACLTLQQAAKDSIRLNLPLMLYY